MNPKLMYYAKYLSFHLSVLNSDDEKVRSTARHSLELHMTKRKVRLAEGQEKSFAGYAMDDSGNIIKASKVNWTKSQWIHLQAMCKRENIELGKGMISYFYRLTVDEDLSVKLDHPKAFYSVFKQKQLEEYEKSFKEKSSQGRTMRETDGHVDHKSSSTFLRNHNISDSLRSFVCRGRLQTLQCESLLSLYYPEAYTKSCKICKSPSETASHVLNGCTKFRGLYQQRHNRIVDLIYNKVKCGEKEVFKDTVLKPTMFHCTMQNFRHEHNRPDIVLVDRDIQRVTIVEIAVPFDAHIPLCFQNKFEKYFPLSLELSELNYCCEIIVLVIGSLGSVHSKFTTGLKKLGISHTEANFLARHCSISSIIGSNRVWRERCKHYVNRPG